MEPNLFYRVCPVNGIATPVIVDENGEVCYVDHDGDFSVLRYNVATGVITEDATDAVMTACESFTGGSFELELSTDASGNTVYTNGDYHIAIDQSGNIVEGEVTLFNSVDPIGIVGDVQVFADNECKSYFSGYGRECFVRVNKQVAVDSSLNFGNGPGDESNTMYVEAGHANGTLGNIMAYIDWMPTNEDRPTSAIIAGTVYEVVEDQIHTIVNNAKVIFSE